MKYLFLFLISLPAFSNSFELLDTGSRFTLKITKDQLVYSSEALKKSIPLSACSLKLAKELNGELIRKLPRTIASEGVAFKVDDKLIPLAPKDELLHSVLAMDSRILRFTVEEREACK